MLKDLLGRGYETEDIYQIGCMGFVKAIRRFNAEFDVKLSTYAVPYILGDIKRFLRDDGPIKVSRSLKELNIKILELQKEYVKNHNEELSIGQISKLLKVPTEEIAMALESSNPIDSLEDAKYTDYKTDKSVSIVEKISTNIDEASIITNKITIHKLIEGLEQREKEIIMLRFYKDKTQSQVAKILGISQVQVSRIEKKILKNMKMKIVS